MNLKRYYIFFLLIFAVKILFAANTIQMSYSNAKDSDGAEIAMIIPVFSVDDAMEAYVGVWEGSQVVSSAITGEKISTLGVAQTISQAEKNVYDMVVRFDLSGGRNIFSQWKIEKLANALKMSLVGADGKAEPKYLGNIQLTGIAWEPYYCVLAYDVMLDTFERRQDGGLYLKSTGFSTITDKRKGSFLLRSECDLRKVK